MKPRYSGFATRYLGETGTRLLMDDLGLALEDGDRWHNLGGGNPAQIPQLQARFSAAMQGLLDSGEFSRLSSAYDGPQGYRPFLRAVAKFFRSRFGWPIGEEHVAVTAGSQASFFVLFSIFAGVDSSGELCHIDLPLTPEYIGYADLCATPSALRAARPRFVELADGMFKYAIDFARYAPDARTGAICVSRPTNPTGNVLAGEEIERLLGLAAAVDVPLIIDNAYGVPFPGIVFTDVTPFYDERVIFCLSLSKLGLPGMRTGIVVARPDWIAHLRSFNAILTLATSSLGAALVTPLFESGAVLDLARNDIQPYYAHRLAQALGWLREHLHDVDFRVHKPEGAIFLWLWFPRLPISAAELYARLKRRRVLIIPGHFFFPGLDGEWAHRHQCIRLSYAQSPRAVELGIRILGEELRAAHANG